MFARFNENPAMTLQDVKETKRYKRTHARRMDAQMDNVKTVYSPQTKFAGGIKVKSQKDIIPLSPPEGSCLSHNHQPSMSVLTLCNLPNIDNIPIQQYICKITCLY